MRSRANPIRVLSSNSSYVSHSSSLGSNSPNSRSAAERRYVSQASTWSRINANTSPRQTCGSSSFLHMCSGRSGASSVSSSDVRPGARRAACGARSEIPASVAVSRLKSSLSIRRSSYFPPDVEDSQFAPRAFWPNSEESRSSSFLCTQIPHLLQRFTVANSASSTVPTERGTRPLMRDFELRPVDGDGSRSFEKEPIYLRRGQRFLTGNIARPQTRKCDARRSS